jgi:hypothetical protein
VIWTYEQRTGILRRGEIEHAHGYSGYGTGKNNPASEKIPNIGPIPRGRYWITVAHSDPSKGPVVMRLLPQPKTQLYGRSGFLIHGDSRTAPGAASRGCIILSRIVRDQIASGGCDEIEVV